MISSPFPDKRFIPFSNTDQLLKFNYFPINGAIPLACPLVRSRLKVNPTAERNLQSWRAKAIRRKQKAWVANRQHATASSWHSIKRGGIGYIQKEPLSSSIVFRKTDPGTEGNESRTGELDNVFIVASSSWSPVCLLPRFTLVFCSPA